MSTLCTFHHVYCLCLRSGASGISESITTVLCVCVRPSFSSKHWAWPVVVLKLVESTNVDTCVSYRVTYVHGNTHTHTGSSLQVNIGQCSNQRWSGLWRQILVSVSPHCCNAKCSFLSFSHVHLLILR